MLVDVSLDLRVCQAELNAAKDTIIIDAFNRLFGGRPIRFLEIGVYKVATLKRLLAADIELACYVGVDPFLGSEEDPYTGSYWASPIEADACCREAEAFINAKGQRFVRQTSDDFFASSQETFDVIFIDGDHRYAKCLEDLGKALCFLAPGGIIMADDYDNIIHPGVTSAVNDFCWRNRTKIRRKHYIDIPFLKPDRHHFPISLKQVFLTF